jgi:radical SAM superfamily enzyme YgiQ (UPF0313 family)
MRNAKSVGIKIHGCFILGLPNETKETVERTIDFAINLDPDTIQMYPMMVYPGTPAFDWAERKGFLKTKDWKEWIKPDGTHNTVIDRPNLPAEFLVEKCDEALTRFYLRRSKMLSIAKASMSNYQDFKRYFVGLKTYLSYLVKK